MRAEISSFEEWKTSGHVRKKEQWKETECSCTPGLPCAEEHKTTMEDDTVHAPFVYLDWLFKDGKFSVTKEVAIS